MATKPYYAPESLSAAYYDLVTAADMRLAGDLEIYAGLAPPGGSILELGAGSGRLTFALAERGFSVVGVDIAKPMLAQAQARLPAKGVELQLGDMTALDLKRTFDLVICPYFTLAHVPTGAAWRNTFATAARHLEAGGLAAFHLPVAEIMALPGPADPKLPVMDQPLPGGGRLQLFVRKRRWREDIGRLVQTIGYVELDAAGKAVRKSDERMVYYLTDPGPAATFAGLALDRDPIPLGGVGHIWVFRKLR
jgi:SAM-dependent methyltransferase